MTDYKKPWAHIIIDLNGDGGKSDVYEVKVSLPDVLSIMGTEGDEVVYSIIGNHMPYRTSIPIAAKTQFDEAIVTLTITCPYSGCPPKIYEVTIKGPADEEELRNPTKTNTVSLDISTVDGWMAASSWGRGPASRKYHHEEILSELIRGLLRDPDYEYEMLIDDAGTPFEISSWIPIATDRIKDPDRIDEYIEKGLLRKIELSEDVRSLPGDEQIEIEIYQRDFFEKAREIGFKEGAEWMRNQAKGKVGGSIDLGGHFH